MAELTFPTCFCRQVGLACVYVSKLWVSKLVFQWEPEVDLHTRLEDKELRPRWFNLFHEYEYSLKRVVGDSAYWVPFLPSALCAF